MCYPYRNQRWDDFETGSTGATHSRLRVPLAAGAPAKAAGYAPESTPGRVTCGLGAQKLSHHGIVQVNPIDKWGMPHALLNGNIVYIYIYICIQYLSYVYLINFTSSTRKHEGQL